MTTADRITQWLSLATAGIGFLAAAARLWRRWRGAPTPALPVRGRFARAAIRVAQNREASWFFLGAGVVAVVLVLYIQFRPVSPAPTLRISSPAYGDHVGRSTEIVGLSGHVRSRDDIWVFVQSHRAPGFFPQPGPAAKQGDAWSNRAYFRYGASRGARDEVYAVLASRRASREIARYFERREAVSGTAGVFVMPDGAQIKDAITVVEGAAPTRETGCAHRRIETASLTGSAKITTVQRGVTVPRALDPLEGMFRNVAASSRLWIFVYSTLARRFYPQTHQQDQPADLRNGRFRSAAFFGGQPGEHYEILAVLTSRSASQLISQTLRTWRAQGNYKGWGSSELPAGVDEKDCVPVVLRP